MKYFSLGLCFLLFSCSPHTDLILDKEKIIGFSNLHTEIDSIQKVDWHVGDHHSEKLHKGFVLHVRLPRLKVQDLKKILSTTKVDSWLVRLIKKSSNEEKELITLQVPFVGSFFRPGELKYESPEFVYFNIYYTPAAISSRVANLKCPTMNHRKLIDDYDIIKDEQKGNLIIGYNDLLNQTPPRSQIMPEVIDGGISLVGEYVAYLALYNEKDKIRYSDFIKVGNTLKITSEDEKQIRECDNFSPPSPESYDEKMKKFKLNN